MRLTINRIIPPSSLRALCGGYACTPVRSRHLIAECTVTSVSTKYSAIAHELDSINPFVILYELVDVPMIHPLRHHGKSMVSKIYAKQR